MVERARARAWEENLAFPRRKGDVRVGDALASTLACHQLVRTAIEEEGDVRAEGDRSTSRAGPDTMRAPGCVSPCRRRADPASARLGAAFPRYRFAVGFRFQEGEA